MRNARRLYWALLLAAGFAACDLNPQPLPPGDETGDRDNGSSGSGGIQAPTTTPGSSGSSGGGEGPPNGGEDAASGGDSGPTPNPDGGEEAGDGGDAGDATTD